MLSPLPLPAPFPYTTLFRSCTFAVIKQDGTGAINLSRALTRCGWPGPYFRLTQTEPGGHPPIPSSYSRVAGLIDRKSTRLNSSHVAISYAVFCLKKNINPPASSASLALRHAVAAAAPCTLSLHDALPILYIRRDQTGRDRGDQPESCPDTVWLARSVLSSYPNRAWGAPSYTFVILKSGRADSIPHLLLNLAQLLQGA